MSIVKHGLIYTVAQFITTFVGLISFPVLTKNLSPEDYGLIGLYTITAGFIASIGKLGIQNSILRLRGDYEESLFVSNIVFLFVVGPVLICFSLIVLSSVLNSYYSFEFSSFDVILVLILIALSEQMRGFLINFILSKQKSYLVAKINVVSKLLTTFMTLTAVLLVLSTAKSFIIAVLIAEVIVIFFLIYVIIKLDILKDVSINKVHEVIYRPILRFGFPLLLLEIVAMFHAFIDRYIIKYYMEDAYLGYYSAYYNMAVMISGLVVGGFMLAIVPAYMDMWNNNGKKKTEIFLSEIANILLLCLPILVASLYVISKDLFDVLTTDGYSKFYYLLPVIAFGVLINSTSPVYSAGLKLKKNSTFLLYAVLLSTVVNLILNILFVPMFGLIGAASSTVVSFSLVCIILIMAGMKTIRFSFDFFCLARGLLYSVSFIFISELINFESSIINLVSKILLGCIFFPVVLFIFEKKYTLIIFDLLKKARS